MSGAVDRGGRDRALAVLPYLLPPVVLLGVYWQGLWVWFHRDDFTLLWHVTRPAGEFWADLFQPRAQGTFRTLSERLFFFYFHRWFGLDAFPYRVLVFATQIVNLGLFAWLARRLGGSRLAAGVAASLWAAQPGLAVTMSWSSAYNQALLALFLLSALHLFITFAERGGAGWYTAQWLVFVAGFSALESIVVYPAIAIGYCLLYRRDRLIWAAPLLLGSAALAWVQLTASPPDADGYYRMSFAPADLAATAGFYLRRSFAGPASDWLAWALAGALLAASLAVWRSGRPAAALGWVWFGASLAPYLPLNRHLSEYYLLAPAAGLALAAGEVSAAAVYSGWSARAALVAAMATHLSVSLPYACDIVADNHRMSLRARNLVTGLRYVRARQPDKTVLLTGVDEDFFYASIYHRLLPFARLYNVYLAPDHADIRQQPGREPVERYVLSEADTRLGLARDAIVVYDASGLRLRETTSRYKSLAAVRLGAQ